MGNYAFGSCSGLTSITIPNSVTWIGWGAFEGCSGLTSISIPNSVTSLNRDVFKGCINLTSVTIPNSVKIIVYGAFENCSSLTSINIPNSVTEIGENAFCGCNNLTSITIPISVTSINKKAFSGCSSITAVKVPITNYESFCSNKTLACIYSSLEKPVQLINSEGSEIKDYIVPEGVTFIGSNAFINCSGLTSIMIPNSVTSIGNCAFRNCKGLTSVKIPNSVTSIREEAFLGCGSLTSIIIGSGIKTIYNSAFASCPELTDVYCYAENVPNAKSDVFQVSNENATLHVPAASINAYQTTEPWKDFKSIVIIDMPKHTLTYIIDEEVYKTYQLAEGETITPEPAPTKEGYTFSGWSEIPETMPAHDVTVTGTFNIIKYKLTYTIGDEEYKSYEIEYDATITPEAAPTKEGYTFSGWSEIPETMPAHDVTITGTFTINMYKLTYIVDGVEYMSYEVEYGTSITPEAEPSKEGYTFSGWSEIPETMPAEDVTITGTFNVNKYKLTYMVDGEVYESYEVEYGTTITPEAEPTKEGFTFSGWSWIPETMPAQDVTITGTFSVNSYKLTYMIDDEVYKEVTYEYGATITPEPQPEGDYDTFEWTDLPQTMPAHDVVVYANYTTGIVEVLMSSQRNVRIYSPNGKKLNRLQKGLNIVIYDDGTTHKIMVK